MSVRVHATFGWSGPGSSPGSSPRARHNDTRLRAGGLRERFISTTPGNGVLDSGDLSVTFDCLQIVGGSPWPVANDQARQMDRLGLVREAD